MDTPDLAPGAAEVIAGETPSGPKVVELRDGKPTLQEISAFLRMLADDIDASSENDIRSVIIISEDDYGRIQPPRCLGVVHCRDHAIGIMHRAMNVMTQ